MNARARYATAAAPANEARNAIQPHLTSTAPAAHAPNPATPRITGPAAANAGIGRRPAAMPMIAPGTSSSKRVTAAAANMCSSFGRTGAGSATPTRAWGD